MTDYKSKYIKYKQKYLKLKGGAEPGGESNYLKLLLKAAHDLFQSDSTSATTAHGLSQSDSTSARSVASARALADGCSDTSDIMPSHKGFLGEHNSASCEHFAGMSDELIYSEYLKHIENTVFPFPLSEFKTTELPKLGTYNDLSIKDKIFVLEQIVFGKASDLNSLVDRLKNMDEFLADPKIKHINKENRGYYNNRCWTISNILANPRLMENDTIRILNNIYVDVTNHRLLTI